MNRDPQIQCPKCKGSGYGHINLLDEHDNYVSDIGPCHYCGGSGYVSKSHNAKAYSKNSNPQPSYKEDHESLPF